MHASADQASTAAEAAGEDDDIMSDVLCYITARHQPGRAADESTKLQHASSDAQEVQLLRLSPDLCQHEQHGGTPAHPHQAQHVAAALACCPHPL